MERKLLLSATLISVICIAAFYSSLSFHLLLILLTGLIISLQFLNNLREYTIPLLLVVVYTLSLLLNVGKTEKISSLDGKYQSARITITSLGTTSDYGHSYEAKIYIPGEGLKSKAVLYCPSDELICGSKYTADIKINPLEPGSYKASCFGKGIYCTCNLKSEPILTGKSPLYTLAGRLRRYIISTFTNYLSTDTSATMCALIFGDKSAFSEDFNNSIKNAGVSHIMVVSGLHLSIIMGGLMWLLSKIKAGKWISFSVIIAANILICTICGFTLSIIRASITFTLCALAPLIRREYDITSALCFTVIAVSIASPFAIMSISFELSILSTFAIAVVVPFFTANIQKSRNKILKSALGLFSPFVCTFFATLFTLPITYNAFGYISLSAPVTNFCLSYLINILLIMGIISLIVVFILPFGFINKPIFLVCGALAKAVNKIIVFFGRQEYTYTLPGNIGAITLLPMAICLLYIIFSKKFKYKRLVKLYGEQNPNPERG